jgi:hypothetical protein
VSSDHPTSTGLYGSLILFVLVGLSVFHFISNASWPAFLRVILARLPGPAMINLFRFSMAGEVPAGALWANAAALAAAAGALFAITVWVIRRAER